MQWAGSGKQTPQTAYAPQQGEHLRRPQGTRAISIPPLPWLPSTSCFGSSNPGGSSDANLSGVLLYSEHTDPLSTSSCQPSQHSTMRGEREGLHGYVLILYTFHTQNKEARKFPVPEKAVRNTRRAARCASRAGTRKSRLGPALPSPGCAPRLLPRPHRPHPTADRGGGSGSGGQGSQHRPGPPSAARPNRAFGGSAARRRDPSGTDSTGRGADTAFPY